jgi:hypothetical protein
MIKPIQTANSITTANVMKLAPLMMAAVPKHAMAQTAISCRAAMTGVSYDPLDGLVN